MGARSRPKGWRIPGGVAGASVILIGGVVVVGSLLLLFNLAFGGTSSSSTSLFASPGPGCKSLTRKALNYMNGVKSVRKFKPNDTFGEPSVRKRLAKPWVTFVDDVEFGDGTFVGIWRLDTYTHDTNRGHNSSLNGQGHATNRDSCSCIM